VIGYEGMAESCFRGNSGWILGKKFFTERVVKHWKAPQGSGQGLKSVSVQEAFGQHS